MDEAEKTRLARDIIVAWMIKNKATASTLAQLAGLNRTVVHRFLAHARPMQMRTSLRIYVAVHSQLDEEMRNTLIDALDLNDIRLITQTQRMKPPTPIIEEGYAAGISILIRGIQLIEMQQSSAAAEVLRDAEQAMQIWRELALVAAYERVQCLIETSCYNSARSEIERIANAYGTCMGIESMLRMIALRGRLTFDLSELPDSWYWYRKLIDEAELHENTARRSEALCYMALIRLAHALRSNDPRRRQAHLSEAQRIFRLHDDYEKRSSTNSHAAGFRALHWAQIHRARSDDVEARRARRLAHSLLRGTPAMHHLCLEVAKIALTYDQIERSRHLATEAHEIAVAADNGMGVAQSSYLLAITHDVEGNPFGALDHAIVAAALAPNWCYEDGTSAAEFMRYIVRANVARLEQTGRATFEPMLHTRIVERRGAFAVLDKLHAAQDRTPLYVLGKITL